LKGKCSPLGLDTYFTSKSNAKLRWKCYVFDFYGFMVLSGARRGKMCRMLYSIGWEIVKSTLHFRDSIVDINKKGGF
jgi:hypothetical protein